MAKKALPLRIDEDLLARVEVRRKELGQTRTLFVERALEFALNGGSTVTISREVVDAKVPVEYGLRFSPEEDAAHDAASRTEMARQLVQPGSKIVMRFRCPDAQCPRRFGSGAAVCPDHGRKAVEG